MKWTRRFVADQQGSALFETALVLPIFLVMMVGIIMFGPLVYTRLAVDEASYTCVTAAVEAVSSEYQGHYQGRTAAWETLRRFGLDPARISVYIWSDGAWGRGARMVCRVDYDLRLSRLPGVSAFFPGSDRVVSGRTALMVEMLKSDWW